MSKPRIDDGTPRYYCKNCRCPECGNTFAAADDGSPILAFQTWLTRYVADHRKLTQDEYLIAQAAFIAAHPGEGPVSAVQGPLCRACGQPESAGDHHESAGPRGSTWHPFATDDGKLGQEWVSKVTNSEDGIPPGVATDEIEIRPALVKAREITMLYAPDELGLLNRLAAEFDAYVARVQELERDKADDMPWAEATERTGHDTLRHLVLDYQKLQELLEKANHGYADQIRLYNEMRADRDRYLAKLNHLESAIEKMVPMARVLELEAETAKYDEMRQGYMDHMNAKVQELEREVARLTKALVDSELNPGSMRPKPPFPPST